MKTFNAIISLIVCLGSSMIGYNVNLATGSSWPFFWAIVDFFFWPLAWIKWLIMGQVNLTLIKNTFAAFLS